MVVTWIRRGNGLQELSRARIERLNSRLKGVFVKRQIQRLGIRRKMGPTALGGVSIQRRMRGPSVATSGQVILMVMTTPRNTKNAAAASPIARRR